MPAAPARFRLDSTAAGRRILDMVARQFPHDRQTGQSRSTTYYDTFDWRVFHHKSRLKSQFDGRSRVLHWVRDDGSSIQRSPISAKPGFVRDLPPGGLRDGLQEILLMRRLLPLFTIEAQADSLNILDSRTKTVARLFMDQTRAHPARGQRPSVDLPVVLRAVPVRGYDKQYESLVQVLESENLQNVDEDEFDLGASVSGLRPGSYSRRLDIQLEPTMRADEAVKVILKRLLQVMRQNEEGLRANIDSEFLHDFRVSVRRTRSVLSQLKGVLPSEIVARFKIDFSWLGQITGPTRDLDVYQLKMPDYRARLPESLRTDLDPLDEFLERHQKIEHQELIQFLNTRRYLTLLEDWVEFLEQPLAEDADRPHGASPILELASGRIWRSVRKVLKKGSAIDPDTPPEALHRVRIECKKLRYLLEFFRSLYPADKILPLINNLKRLQDNLGDFNDLEVQQKTLRLYAQTMLSEKTGTVSSFMAMGRLVERLEEAQAQERQVFHKRFARFSSRKNRHRFKQLFKPVEIDQT